MTLFPASVHVMNFEAESEIAPEEAKQAGLGAWQKVALVVALVSTLGGLALGGFGSESVGASGASPQAESFAAGGGVVGASGEAQETAGMWAPLLAKGGLSFLLAFCVGYAVRVALKVLFLAVGLAALAVFGLQYAGFLGEVQWDRLTEFWEIGVAAAKDQADGFQAFVSGRLPSATSGGLGLLVGFRRTG